MNTTKTVLVVALVALMSGSVMAKKPPSPPGQNKGGDSSAEASASSFNSNINSNKAYGGDGGQGGSASSFNSNINSNKAYGGNANQGQAQGQQQGQGQGQSQDSRQANSQTMNYTESDRSDTYRKYTPSVAPPSIGTTVPCLVPISGGAGVPGFVASLGTGVLDEGCVERETIRLGLASDDKQTKDMANTALQSRLGSIIVKDVEEEVAAEELKANTDSTAYVFKEYNH